jgi:hypothetical protein
VLVDALPAAVASGRFPLPAGASLGSAVTLNVSARAAAAYVAALPLPRRGRVSTAPSPAAAATAVCVLHLGVHTSATRVHLERCAVNTAAFRCADEAGWAPQCDPVLPADEAGCCRYTRLPVDALVERLAASGFPVRASDDAGTFICNYTFYLTLAAMQQAQEEDAVLDVDDAEDAAHALSPTHAEPPWHALFVHVPPAEVMPVEQQTSFLAALMAAITAHLLGDAARTAEPSV